MKIISINHQANEKLLNRLLEIDDKLADIVEAREDLQQRFLTVDSRFKAEWTTAINSMLDMERKLLMRRSDIENSIATEVDPMGREGVVLFCIVAFAAALIAAFYIILKNQ